MQLCEINLGDVLPADALSPFIDEIKKRDKQRKRLAKKVSSSPRNLFLVCLLKKFWTSFILPKPLHRTMDQPTPRVLSLQEQEEKALAEAAEFVARPGVAGDHGRSSRSSAAFSLDDFEGEKRRFFPPSHRIDRSFFFPLWEGPYFLAAASSFGKLDGSVHEPARLQREEILLGRREARVRLRARLPVSQAGGRFDAQLGGGGRGVHRCG